VYNKHLNVDNTGFVTLTVLMIMTCDVFIVMLRLFLTVILTMTQHFWQQTQNDITKKLGEHVAIKVLIFGWQNGKIQHL